MLNLNRSFAALTLLGLLAAQAGAQDAQSSLDGAWRGTLRCEKNALVTARLDVRMTGDRFEALLQPLSVTGGVSGADLVKAPVRLTGTLSGNAIDFTATATGRSFPNLKAGVKDAGRTITATLPAQTGCSGLYFTRTAPTLAQAAVPAPVTSAPVTPAPTTPVPQPAGTDASALTGVWVGRYICAQGSTGLLMAVQGKADGIIQTRLSFYPLPENPFVPAGTLDVQSRLQGDRLVNLQSNWVSRPQGFTFGVGGRVTLSEDAQTLSIVPEGAPGCLKLEVQRQP